jgi:hypothetical protein
MAFWVVLVQIVKIVLAVKQYADLLAALQSGNLVEGLISSYLARAITSGMVKSGIPIDRFDFRAQAGGWAD